MAPVHPNIRPIKKLSPTSTITAVTTACIDLSQIVIRQIPLEHRDGLAEAVLEDRKRARPEILFILSALLNDWFNPPLERKACSSSQPLVTGPDDQSDMAS